MLQELNKITLNLLIFKMVRLKIGEINESENNPKEHFEHFMNQLKTDKESIKELTESGFIAQEDGREMLQELNKLESEIRQKISTLEKSKGSPAVVEQKGNWFWQDVKGVWAYISTPATPDSKDLNLF